MASDPRKLKPSELCRLLNSTPIGEVLSDRQLHRHRMRAGNRIGDGKHVDLLRYIAWLVQEKHAPRKETDGDPYERMKENARARNAAMALAGRDIGELPAIVDPDRKARAKTDFRFFCEAYFPQTFHLPWSPDHLKVIGRIEQAVLRGGLFSMAMPRGSGKTSVCECACIWAVLNGHREFVCLIGSDEGHACDMLDRPTCHLRRDYEGIWRGSWLEYERMPIEVIPEVEWKPTVDAIDPTQSRLLITVATGDSFRELLRYTGPLMEAYAKRIGADFVAITKPTQNWWGLEKFRVQPFAQSYERTLYVDADVFLTEETPDLFEVVPAGHVSMHDDWSQLPRFEWVFEERRNILESQETPMDYSKVVLNSGIVICDRKHASIWKPPLHPFFPTHCSEQFWIQNNARGLPFFQLPTEFNTQYWMPNFRDLVPTAKVIHLANCTPEKRLEFARQFTSSLANA